MHDVIVVGAGVVGCAIARELARFDLDCVVVEAGPDVGVGTSKANTAILHTGFDAKPGTLEARLVRRGYERLRDFAAQAGIPVEPIGALLVAWDDEQEARLAALAEQARQNGVGDTRRVTAGELYRREPHLGRGARAALEVPGESIICPWTTPLALATQAGQGGVRFVFDCQVQEIGPGHELATTRGRLRSRWLVNAAGLRADEIDRALGHDRFTVTPRRGELIVFDKLARPLVNHILLPVPSAASKGVLVAPTVFGNVMLGPTAEDLEDKADTGSSARGLEGLLEHGRRILPALIGEEVTAVYAGLRAATEHADYQIHLDAGEAYVCVGGIRSTGLTAAMAIAEHVVELLREAGLALRVKGDLPPVKMPNLGEAFDRPYQRAELIARDPAYGEIVCHCERVTRGEIRDACRSALPAPNLDGLRRRTRALMGRCQGFYCLAEVAALFARERGCTMAEVLGLVLP